MDAGSEDGVASDYERLRQYLARGRSGERARAERLDNLEAACLSALADLPAGTMTAPWRRLLAAIAAERWRLSRT
jgi:hypothetical protein